MKVAQLSTSDMGGAGIAAKNLHLELLNRDFQSTFFTKVNLGLAVDKHVIIDLEIKKNIFNRIIKRIENTIKYRFPFFNNDLNYYLQNRKNGFEYFSFPYSSIQLNDYSEIIKSDIINLHWIADEFVDYKDVFSFNKKYVWTLHDMNPFTGGCHHSDGCTKFTMNCNFCFQLEGTPDEYISHKILNYKIDSLKSIKDNQLIIVAPSQWLLNLSKSSKCFSRFKHVLIPNVIDFTPSEKKHLEHREFYKIEKEEIVFLFVAHSVLNIRKGIPLLIKALNKLSHKRNITLVTIGEKSGIKLDGIKTIELGFVTDKRILSEVYSLADAFLLPSLAENFPNTIVESLLAGTPVIAANIGGIPEQINDKNGILVKNNEENNWVDVLTYFIENKDNYNRQEISEDAMLKYETGAIIEKYINVYNALLK